MSARKPKPRTRAERMGRKARTAQVMVRLSLEEQTALEQCAGRSMMPLATWMRWAAMSMLKAELDWQGGRPK